MKMKNLKVISVRYFETRRGLGYECKTNIPNVIIWNDGDYGCTYIEPCIEAKRLKLYQLSEHQLEDLINEFENVKAIS